MPRYKDHWISLAIYNPHIADQGWAWDCSCGKHGIDMRSMIDHSDIPMRKKFRIPLDDDILRDIYAQVAASKNPPTWTVLVAWADAHHDVDCIDHAEAKRISQLLRNMTRTKWYERSKNNRHALFWLARPIEHLLYY